MQAPLRILVVEDNPADADLLEEMLSETAGRSFRIESVPRLSAALARLENQDTDLVLLDLGLPDSHGLETCRLLRQAVPDLPVIVLTGSNDLELAVTAVREGAQDFLVKGQFTANLLARAIQYAMERNRAENVRSFLAQNNSAPGGEPFFHALARYLAQTLSMDFICIDRLEGDGLSARTVAVWSDGHFEDNITYALKDTPCGHVVGRQVCCFPASVRQLFPQDLALQTLRAESYLGVTLCDHVGKPIGLIAAISRNPLANREQAEATMKLVALRASGEMERIETEAVLRDSEEKFRMLFENANDAIFLMQGDMIIDCNARALEMFACQSRDQLVGHSPVEFSPPLQPDAQDSHQLANEMITRSLAGGRQCFEWMHKRLDGTLFATEVSLNAITLGGKQIVQAIVRDVTERKKAQEALEKKSAEMERFTYAVSHDLKSPLITVKTFLGYLEKDLKAQKEEQAAKDLEFIHGAADKMGLLLEDLLKLARVGYRTNAKEQVTFQEIVQEAMLLVAGQISERGVEVEVTHEPVWLYGDRIRLVEVFQNLIDNAVKFLGSQPAPRIEIGVEVAGDELVLFVRDNGKGIDPQHQAKVFGMFEKFDASAPGFGLGLALVQRIVEIHGGRIWVESQGLGRGTTFRLTLAGTHLEARVP